MVGGIETRLSGNVLRSKTVDVASPRRIRRSRRMPCRMWEGSVVRGDAVEMV